MVQIRYMKIINERVIKSKKNLDKLSEFIRLTFEVLFNLLLIQPNVDRNKINEIDIAVLNISNLITTIDDDVQNLSNIYQFNEIEIMNDDIYDYTNEHTLRIHSKTEQSISDGKVYFYKCLGIINNIKNIQV